MSMQELIDQWKWVGSAVTLLSTGVIAVRKVGGPRKVLLVIRSQWHLNLVILDKDSEIARLKANESRALKGEMDANARTEEIAATLQLMMVASAAVREAREKGLIVTFPLSSPPPAITYGSSSTLPPTPGEVLTIQ